MAAKPPRPGAWQPEGRDSGGPPKAETEIFQIAARPSSPAPDRSPASDRSPAPDRSPRAPRRPDPPAPSPVDLAGPSTGRGLKGGGSGGAPDAAAPSSPGDPALSPFQRFAPTADQLSGAAQARSGESLQVVAIVTSLVFTVGASGVVIALLLVVGWWTMGDMIEDGALAGLVPGQGHIKDTDVAVIAEPTAPTGRKGAGGATAPADGEGAGEAVATGPTTGPGTIRINGDVYFLSIEVNCPDHGIRARADFRNKSATVRGLPTDEDCTVTFQGSQPARTTLRGGQTKSCTFDPTLCLVQ